MDSFDIKILIALSGKLQIEKNLYNKIAEEVGIEIEELLKRLNAMKEKGYLKRIAPVLRHRNTEYKFNGMAVFEVYGESKEKIIKRLKETISISHVYERTSSENWPYNIYGMTHGRSEKEVEETIKNISEGLEIKKFKILYSTKEYKKISPNIEYLLEK